MSELLLSIPLARLVAVAAQGLLKPPARPARKEDLLSAVRALGALQIDTINIVARSPYLALFSRLGDYHPAWLDELLAEGQLFEYWAHAACFLPAEDYPLHRRIALEGQRGWFSQDWYQANRPVVDGVIETIRANGAARSVDFERADGKKGTWWDWKVEKRALEYWFARGDLMTARRQNFQRVYDLRERVRPGWDDRLAPPLEEVESELVLRAVRALGVARAGWIPDYFRRPKPAVSRNLRRLVAEGRLLEIPVEGWEEPGYAHPDLSALLAEAQAGRLHAEHTTLLSPFDSLTWDRKRTRALFDFDFALECYLPASRRKYGYFLLPILHRGEFIGRLDAKAHRKEKLFEVIALYLEPSIQPDEELAATLMSALRDCARWHAAAEVIVRRTEPAALADLLARA